MKYVFLISFFKSILAFVPFLLLPMITAKLDIEDFGRYSLAQVIVTILLPFICLNIQTYQRKKSVENLNDRLHYLLTSLVLIFFSSTILIVMYLVFSLFFTPPTFSYNEWLIIAFASLSVATLTSVETYFSSTLDYKKIMISLTSTTFFIWGGVYLLIIREGIWLGRLYSQLFYGLALFGFVIYCIWKIKKAKFDLLVGSLLDGVKFGFPLAVVALLGLVTLHLDKLIVSKMFDATEIGYYMGISQIASLIMFLSQSLLFALEPLIYKKPIAKIYKIIILTISLIAFFSILMFYFRYYLFNLLINQTLGEYSFSFNMLIIANFLKAMCLLIMPFLIKINLHRNLHKSYCLILLIYFAMGLLLADKFGVLGLSIGFLIMNLLVLAYLASVVYFYIKRQKFYG
jgi:O-antigen/teichoic acid export membrane protein